MADRAITDLIPASEMYDSDLFAISQGGQAKKVTWQTFYQYLAVTLQGHGGINNITYTAPSAGSLEGTLTVALADGTTEGPFTITNGRGITSITGPVTSGLEDTYTVHYNNGDSSTFTVTNGKGIVSIVNQWAVSASNSTAPSTWYNTPREMTPTNRYEWQKQTITFNSGNPLVTTAVVGVYGDTGAQTYVHIKYAEEEPSSDADMKSSPDAWIGIYTGTESDSSSLHYTDFEWYEYKGETGDTGPQGTAATLVTQDVSYQWGDSGTTAPSGTWSSTVPVKPSSDTFLWTKVDLEFNTGNPITFYSVSHYGVDGTGAVNTVNEIGPDGEGNVTIDAEDIVFASDQTKDVESSILTAESNIDDLEAIAGDGALSGFSSTDLTGAANELMGGKVSKSGDTMTGDLVIQKEDQAPLWLKNSNFTVGTAPSASGYVGVVHCTDKNNFATSSFMSRYAKSTGYPTSGIVETTLRARNKNGSSNVDNTLTLTSNPDGTKAVSMSDVGAWRDALEIDQVDSTSVISNIATNGTDCEITAADFASVGKIAQLRLVVKKTSAVASGNTTMATLVQGKRPVFNTFATTHTNQGTVAYINSNGNVVVNGPITEGQSLTIYSVYILA